MARPGARGHRQAEPGAPHLSPGRKASIRPEDTRKAPVRPTGKAETRSGNQPKSRFLGKIPPTKEEEKLGTGEGCPHGADTVGEHSLRRPCTSSENLATGAHAPWDEDTV